MTTKTMAARATQMTLPMMKSFLSWAMIFKGPASESGISAPSRFGRRLSQMPSAAPRSGSMATRRGPHLRTQLHRGWGTTYSPGVSSAANSACWRAICQSTSDNAMRDASARSQCGCKATCARSWVRTRCTSSTWSERVSTRTESTPIAKGTRMTKMPRNNPSIRRSACVSGVSGECDGSVMGLPRTTTAIECSLCVSSHAGHHGGVPTRLLWALVAAAQLELALASAVFQRPRRRAAGIDAAFHAVDLARGRARPAAAALEGARLPLVLCGAGVLLGHAGRAAREHGRACDYGHLQEPKADQHRDSPTPTVRRMSKVDHATSQSCQRCGGLRKKHAAGPLHRCRQVGGPDSVA